MTELKIYEMSEEIRRIKENLEEVIKAQKKEIKELREEIEAIKEELIRLRVALIKSAEIKKATLKDYENYEFILERFKNNLLRKINVGA